MGLLLLSFYFCYLDFFPQVHTVSLFTSRPVYIHASLRRFIGHITRNYCECIHTCEPLQADVLFEQKGIWVLLES